MSLNERLLQREQLRNIEQLQRDSQAEDVKQAQPGPAESEEVLEEVEVAYFGVPAIASINNIELSEDEQFSRSLSKFETLVATPFSRALHDNLNSCFPDHPICEALTVLFSSLRWSEEKLKKGDHGENEVKLLMEFFGKEKTLFSGTVTDDGVEFCILSFTDDSLTLEAAFREWSNIKMRWCRIIKQHRQENIQPPSMKDRILRFIESEVNNVFAEYNDRMETAEAMPESKEKDTKLKNTN